MEVEIPWAERRVVREECEVGPVTNEDVEYLLKNAPTTRSPSFFRLDFVAEEDAIPETSAKVIINPKGKGFIFGLEDIHFPYIDEAAGFNQILDGGRLETLSLEYPGRRQGKREDYGVAGRALGFLGRNLQTFFNYGYKVVPSSLTIANYMVQVPQSFAPGLFSSYTGKLAISTDEMIKGEPEIKLILGFTHDIEDSVEVQRYKQIFDAIKKEHSS